MIIFNSKYSCNNETFYIRNDDTLLLLQTLFSHNVINLH